IDIIKAMMEYGCQGIFVTHITELAQDVESLNKEIPGGSRLANRIDPPIMENICVVHQFTHNPGFFIKPTFLPRRVG
ncbi:MAG: hypothetical protein QM401_03515, partial [Bacillota bacterium]|nr:hypothetical protein [Bacillota bacterium]